MADGGLSWHYNEDIYLLTDTGETIDQKGIKLNRIKHSVSQKLRRLKRDQYTVEKLIYERDYMLDNFYDFTLTDLADDLGVHRSYLQQRVRAFRHKGDLGKKDRTDELNVCKDEFIIDNYLTMNIEDMAASLNVTVERLEIKVGILKKRGMILQSGEGRKNKYKTIGLKLPKDCVLMEMVLEPFKEKTVTVAQLEYKVIKDYGIFILCERKGIRQCFNKIDFFMRG